MSKIHHQTFGTGAPLVLIHGFGFCGEIFTPLIQKYKHNYQIMTIDLPGHGKSEHIAGLDNWVSEIVPLIPQNATILGWSIGGLVATKLATLLSVEKLILCASTPQFIKTKDWEFGIETSSFQAFNENITANITKGLTRFISLQGASKEIIKDLKTIVANNPPTTTGLVNALDILLTTDTKKLLLSLDNVEVFLGEKDTIVPISINTWYQENNINTRVLDGGHMPFLCEDFKI